MKILSILASLIIIVIFASACSTGNAATPSAAESNTVSATSQAPATQPTVANVPSATLPAPSQSDVAKTDSQGMVTVELTPENLDHPGDSLVFDEAMNTHSVNLGMDLSKLATLTTDTNQSIPASSWDGPKEGGHHVSGKLTFPAANNGKPILEGAKQVTITITDVDAPSRAFTWQLSQ